MIHNANAIPVVGLRSLINGIERQIYFECVTSALHIIVYVVYYIAHT